MSKRKTQAEIDAEAAVKYEIVRDSFDRTDQIVYSLPKCCECGAIVEDDDREKHYDWHRRIAL
jgi:hypothetical protein